MSLSYNEFCIAQQLRVCRSEVASPTYSFTMAANQRHESSLETRGKIIALWDVGYTTHEIADEIDLSVSKCFVRISFENINPHIADVALENVLFLAKLLRIGLLCKKNLVFEGCLS